MFYNHMLTLASACFMTEVLQSTVFAVSDRVLTTKEEAFFNDYGNSIIIVYRMLVHDFGN